MRNRTSGRLVLGDAITDAASLASEVITDPYTPEILCRAKQIVAIHKGQVVPVCQPTPDVPDSFGLGKFMPLARGIVYAEQNTWVYPVAIAVAVGVPFLLGYLVGKK